MRDVFLCGALAHAPLLGNIAPAAEARPARVAGHVAAPVAGGDLTGLAMCENAAVSGIRLSLAPDQQARLEAYLAVYGLSLEPAGECLAVLAADPDPVWDNDRWLRERSLAVVWASEEILAHLPTMGARNLAHRLTPIRMRAALWAKARGQKPVVGTSVDTEPNRDIDRDVVVARKHWPYLNFFSVQEMDLQFRKQDGSLSEVVNRGALMMGEAAAVLPYDPVRDAVLLIQQFRAPVYMGGTRSPWVWEPVAGMVDPGETPEETAHREAMEEAGLTLRHLEPVGPSYGSPGSLSDRLNLFVGLTELDLVTGASGVASEGEDIRSEILPWETFLSRLDAQAYPVLPLMALGLWLARHRDRLRRMA